MASLTLKNIPDDLLARLRAQAGEDRRSLNQQAIYLLERALGEPDPAAEARRQVDLWGDLAGTWESDLSVREEIDSLYRSRSRGRDVEL
ncbi:MAG: hypothetical protein AAGN66_23895 [Acidobacteriota bacterium]